MSVKITFYDKLETSNISYIIQDAAENEDYMSLQPIPPDLVLRPYAFIEHNMNYIRLPSDEDLDEHATIDKLTNELQVLKNKEATMKDNPVQAPMPEKNIFVSDKIEYVAGDPHLIREHAIEEIKIQNVEKSDVTRVVTKTPSKRLILTSKVHLAESRNEEITASEAAIEMLTFETESKKSSLQGVFDETADSSRTTSVGSFVIIDSPSDILSEKEEVQLLKRLNLTRNEMYVTGLYEPRNNTAFSIHEKLQRVKHLKMKTYAERERDAFQKLQENVPFDINYRFKCRASKITNSDVKTNQEWNARKVKKVSNSESKYYWDEYLLDQEEVEMDSALTNSLEKGVLKRLTAVMEAKPVNESAKRPSLENKSKQIKNKNRNNPLQSRRDKQLIKNGLSLKNSNTNKVCESYHDEYEGSNPDNLNELKFPVIKKYKEKHTVRVGHKDMSHVRLPLLSHRNHQESDMLFPHSRNNTKSSIAVNNIFCKETAENIIRKDVTKFTNGVKNTNSNLKKCIEPSDAIRNVSFSNTCEDELQKTKSSRHVYFNINQNQSVDDNDDVNNIDISNSKLDAGTTPELAFNLNGVVESQTSVRASNAYNEKLKLYSCECPCQDCLFLSDTISHDYWDTDMTDYPPFLGRMRQDFNFLKSKSCDPTIKCTSPNRIFDVPEINPKWICDNILKMMDTMMIRKEILTSSLGSTYITITITKPEDT